MEIDEIRRRVEEFPYRYHKIELPGGITTPGWAPMSVEAYKVPPDLSGKPVLDIGAWDGFWTFEALKRGAREAVAIDDFSDLLGLDKAASVCDDLLCLESAILDDLSPYQGGMAKGYPGKQFVMEFYPGKQYSNNESNWWVPTLHCMLAMLRAARMKGVRGWKPTEVQPPSASYCRGFAQGRRKAETP